MGNPIELLCTSCYKTFKVDMVDGLNMVNRNEDFGEPMLYPVCQPEDSYQKAQEEEDDVLHLS